MSHAFSLLAKSNPALSGAPETEPLPRSDLASLVSHISLATSADEVATLLGEWTVARFEPTRCSVLLYREGRLEPLFQCSRGEGPAPERDLLVPIPRGDRVVGAVELIGPQARSQANRRELRIAAHAVGAELARLEAEEALASERERSEQLRRFVPGAVCESIDRHQALDAAERDVTVLFLDIHAYTAHVSLLRCSQVFRFVNGFVQGATRVIRRHGGAVVEFNGDGMMAVFGAPGSLPAKERAAAATALELVETLPPLLANGVTSTQAGIGIASGKGFVGAVSAADRLIWTALGHTTNLASRLQAMTRELSASLVVDEPTWRAAQPLLDHLVRKPRCEVRGFEAPLDLYALHRT
jgi:class 3 adenylate cyclase